MIQGINKRYLEYFFVAMIVAVIVLMALNRYTLIAKDSAVLRLQIISQNFMIGAANARAEYYLRNVVGDDDGITLTSGFSLGEKKFYFSAQGWPVSTRPLLANNFPTHEDCHNLWQAVLQNPEPISSPFKQVRGALIQVFAVKSICRYQLKTGDAWFEYSPADGQLHFSSVSSGYFN